MQLLQYCNITVLWIHGLTAMMLIKGRGEISCMTAFTAVHLYHNVMDTGTDCNDFSTSRRGNGGYACSYCNTVASLCYGYRNSQ